MVSGSITDYLSTDQLAHMLTLARDPVDACKAIVSTAFALALHYDVAVDDMSVIVMFFTHEHFVSSVVLYRNVPYLVVLCVHRCVLFVRWFCAHWSVVRFSAV